MKLTPRTIAESIVQKYFQEPTFRKNGGVVYHDYDAPFWNVIHAICPHYAVEKLTREDQARLLVMIRCDGFTDQLMEWFGLDLVDQMARTHLDRMRWAVIRFLGQDNLDPQCTDDDRNKAVRMIVEACQSQGYDIHDLNESQRVAILATLETKHAEGAIYSGVVWYARILLKQDFSIRFPTKTIGDDGWTITTNGEEPDVVESAGNGNWCRAVETIEICCLAKEKWLLRSFEDLATPNAKIWKYVLGTLEELMKLYRDETKKAIEIAGQRAELSWSVNKTGWDRPATASDSQRRRL